MNDSPLEVIGRITVTLILLLGVLILVGLLLWRPLTPDSKSAVENAISGLLILLSFAVHALLQRDARQSSLHNHFPNSPGPTAPKA
jgi:hypothetical protein